MDGFQTVAISTSGRFHREAREAADRLKGDGLELVLPGFTYDESKLAVKDAETKGALTKRYFDLLPDADLLYVIDRDGYTGTSVCLEVGFATALKIPVVFSEVPKEDALKALSAGTVTLEDLSRSALSRFAA